MGVAAKTYNKHKQLLSYIKKVAGMRLYVCTGCFIFGNAPPP